MIEKHTSIFRALQGNQGVAATPPPLQKEAKKGLKSTLISFYLDGQTDGRRDGGTDQRTNGPTDRWTDGRTDRWTDGRTEKETEKAKNLLPLVFTDGQTERQVDRQRDIEIGS